MSQSIQKRERKRDQTRTDPWRSDAVTSSHLESPKKAIWKWIHPHPFSRQGRSYCHLEHDWLRQRSGAPAQRRYSYERLTKDEYEKQLRETHVAIIDAAESLYRTGRMKKANWKQLRSNPLWIRTILPLQNSQKETENHRHVSGRPIVRTFAAVVHLLDKLLTEWTSSLLARIDGSLIDTTDLINKLPKERLPDDATIHHSWR